MAGRIPVALVGAALAASLPHAHAQAPPPSSQPGALVRYSFDDDTIDAGPDTFAVFQQGQGTVSLSTALRFSGYRSVELRDVPGDHSFPELQGYFPLRSHGKLYLHFAMLTADPAEELNIALAGPKWFTLRKDGIGFWLKTSEGYLTAISDSMPKRLFRMAAFVWYVVDVTYDVDGGTYDLTVRQENVEAPVASMRGQANAANQPGSQVDKFSFIGDHDTDASKVVYYVDDVLVGADEKIVQQPFVAPGRRKLFADYWNEAQRARLRRPGPLPLMRVEDLGIGAGEHEALRQDQGAVLLARILAGESVSPLPDPLSSRTRDIVEAVLDWRAGSAALESSKPEAALARFEHGLRSLPSATLLKMDAAMALAQLARWDDVDARLAGIVGEWRGDARLPVALAMIGLARGDFDGVERQLREGAEASGLMAEEYFLALLWKGESARAAQFAQAMQARVPAAAGWFWLERLGDAAFLAGDVERARAQYEASLGVAHPHPHWVWMKLSDVYFKLGNLEKERSFRERIYGSLGGR